MSKWDKNSGSEVPITERPDVNERTRERDNETETHLSIPKSGTDGELRELTIIQKEYTKRC